MRSLKWFLLLAIILLTACDRQCEEQGYVEGRFRYIAPNYSGILKELLVQRGTQVQAGQTLFVLDSQPESDALKQAEAKLELAKITLARRQSLIAKHAVQQEALDTALSDYRQAEAALMQAQWSQKQKTMPAPNAAFVFDTYFLPGESVPAGKPVLSLLAPQDIKVVFFVTEPELGSIQIGQKIVVNCDGCKSVNAKISFISPQAEYTPPVIYSEDRRAKLVYRIEALPAKLDDAMKLHPGQPVKVHFE